MTQTITDTDDTVAKKASFRIKLAYGMGSVAPGAFNALGALNMFFYNQVIGVPAAVVGLALSAMVFSDAFIDILIGHASDRTRSRWGRRHPFMLAGMLLIPIAIYLRWHPPRDWAADSMFWYIYATGIFVNVAFSIFEIASNALGPELAKAYHDRTNLISYRWTLGAVTAAIATTLIYGVFLRATPEHPIGQLNVEGYGPLSVTITLMVVGSILVMMLGTRHVIPELHQAPPSVRVSLRDQLRQVAGVLTNRNFLVAVVSGLISGLGSGMEAGLRLYFATFLWGFKSSDILVLSLLSMPTPIVAAMIAPRLGARYGKKRACMSLFFASVVLGNLPLLLKLTGVLTLEASPLLLAILGGFAFAAGVCSIGGFILVSSMVSDIVEDVQAKTGERSEGLLMTADSLPSRIVNSLSVALPGIMLAWVAFPAKGTPGPETYELMARVGWIYLPTFAIISILSISVWAFYRIDQQTHERNLRAVA